MHFLSIDVIWIHKDQPNDPNIYDCKLPNISSAIDVLNYIINRSACDNCITGHNI